MNRFCHSGLFTCLDCGIITQPCMGITNIIGLDFGGNADPESEDEAPPAQAEEPPQEKPQSQFESLTTRKRRNPNENRPYQKAK